MTRPARMLLAACGVVVAGFTYASVVWQPISAARAAAATDFAQAAAATVPAPAGDAMATISAGATRARLTIRSIRPQGAATRVVIEDADFARALDWLARLDRDAGLQVVAANIGRRPKPGQVSIDVTLGRP